MTENNGNNNNKNDNKIKFACVAAYFWVLFFVPLIICPDDARGRFHANQGLVLLLCLGVANAVISIVGLILPAFIKGVLYVAAELCGLALTVIGVLNVCADKMSPLPVIGKINIIKQ